MAFNPVAVILRATQLVRGWGIKVTFEPGWETRGNGYRSSWVGGIEHHTGTASAGETNPFPTRTVLRDGRSGLSGPLCNSAGPWDGSVHVVAAQAANHAGASGGRSMGPLPVTTLFNPKVFGHEIDYPGTSPMSPGQYRAAVLWARALLIALVEVGQISRFDAERIRLHYETSITGKWDAGYEPGTPIDAAAMRRAVAAPPEEDDMELTDRVDWDKVNSLGPDYLGHKLLGTWQNSAATRAILTRLEVKLDAVGSAVGKLSDDEANIIAAYRARDEGLTAEEQAVVIREQLDGSVLRALRVLLTETEVQG